MNVFWSESLHAQNLISLCDFIKTCVCLCMYLYVFMCMIDYVCVCVWVLVVVGVCVFVRAGFTGCLLSAMFTA